VNCWVETLVPCRPGFPSTFPPPDARPRGTGRNRQGRRATAEAVDSPFVHVTSDNWGRWGWDGTREKTAVPSVKSPALPTQVRILSLPYNPELRQHGRWPSDQAGFDAPVSVRFPSTRRPADTVGITCAPRAGRAEHALDQPRHPRGGLGKLVDVDQLGERAAVGMAQPTSQPLGFLLGSNAAARRVSLISNACSGSSR
jgi:hypothetical protein